jgi:hypothetical protein
MNGNTLSPHTAPDALEADPAAALREAARIIAHAFRSIRVPAASPSIERRATLAYLAGVGALVSPR